MSDPTSSTSPVSEERELLSNEGGGPQHVQFLTGVNDNYDGVTVHLEDPMDAEDFALKLQASIQRWRQEGKKGIWIKMPIGLANLVETAVQEGFRYHHAEPDYLMLVAWISDLPDTIPSNASHRVGIGAFVLNPDGKVLVVQETGGPFRGTNVWKLPTGVVNQGEHIIDAAVREVREETGIDTDFVEILAFRQSHGSFHGKSDLFFLCVLKAHSYEIKKQESEILAAKWMPVEEYVNQPFVQRHEMFRYMANICVKKMENDYTGFSPVPTTTSSGRRIYMYCNSSHADELVSRQGGSSL
ncbi:PREDICTED: nudix hydrolase 7-like isoform X2 [Tarenaya hassleriana]|nr:PREDICTED: nudix hydrolase 7-like isoform X2 [Tarenaya hassleriana]XP_010532971.1 PREDICTED: nudix hydrolase 7-like isoform X2 [Tarenaya hassleriana]XP_010532972.1 PREDICTED: nudix hydrolase 7-like isoform X2 [Tarenaya hassleriana]